MWIEKLLNPGNDMKDLYSIAQVCFKKNFLTQRCTVIFKTTEAIDGLCTYDLESEDVVNVAVLPAAEVKSVLVHRHLRPVEHRRFVHVVPGEQVRR